MARLTKRLVDHAAPKPGDYFLWDDLAGFGCRIWPSGKKTYLVQYRVNGRTRRATLGAHGVFTVDQARALAQQWLAAVARGEDPAQARQARRQALTVGELVARYQAEYLPRLRPSTQRVYQTAFATHILPAFGTRPLPQLTRADILSLHAQLRTTPNAANRVLRLLASLLRLADDWGLLADGRQLCRGIKGYRERQRERVLTGEELARLGEVLRTYQVVHRTAPAVVAALRLLLFTGARVQEVLTLRWAMLDLARGTARLPDSKTGAKTVHLSAAAVEVLTQLPRTEGHPYVLPGRKPGEPLHDITATWQTIQRHAGLDGVRLHDLRHTFASWAVSGGASLYITQRLLGHSTPAMTQRYAHLAPDPLREAADTVGEALRQALG